MRKYVLLFIIVSLFIFTSCKNKDINKDDNIDPVYEILLCVDSSTIKDEYYLDEFNIQSIKLIVTENDSITTISLKSDMVIGLDSIHVGINNLTVSYKEKTTSFSINIVEEEYYTQGLVFRANEELSEYKVVGYNGDETKVIIPAIYNHLPVVEIASSAFKDNQVVEEVVLNEGLSKIGNSSFQNTIVKSINIPSTLSSIGTAAFYLNEVLDYIYLPKTLKSVGDKALEGVKIIMLEDTLDDHSYSSTFRNANSSYLYENIDKNYLLKNDTYIYYKDTIIKYIGSSTSSIIIPNFIDEINITTIGDYAFYNHLEITNITLPINLELIKTHAFHFTSITEIIMPSTLKEIGEYAFAYCESLVTVNFNEGLIRIDHSAFNSCRILDQLIFPSTLTTIDAFAFQNCYVTSNVYIPKGVTFIGNGCFYSNSRAVFYLEASEIPSTWDSNWNPSSKKAINYNVDIWS